MSAETDTRMESLIKQIEEKEKAFITAGQRIWRMVELNLYHELRLLNGQPGFDVKAIRFGMGTWTLDGELYEFEDVDSEICYVDPQRLIDSRFYREVANLDDETIEILERIEYLCTYVDGHEYVASGDIEL